jgi:hypothetical protein
MTMMLRLYVIDDSFVYYLGRKLDEYVLIDLLLDYLRENPTLEATVCCKAYPKDTKQSVSEVQDVK